MLHLPALYVDLGYGAYPITSKETLRRLRRLNPRLSVLGVEIDPQRVADALPFLEPGLEFRLGGFNLSLRPGERVSVIRAFNILWQYGEEAVAGALAALETTLMVDGLLIEGTCDPTGWLMTFNLYRKVGASSFPAPMNKHPAASNDNSSGRLEQIAFVLAPGLRVGFSPRKLQAVLPKNLIHHAEPGGSVDRFLSAWHAS